uniref:CCHC-type domain-containing protein n=1 Tax=Strongyloides papillosus TaxID=174720 RepID=A0A0N5C2W9_STREA
MVANWEAQPEFDSVKVPKISTWIDALELRFNLDDLSETLHGTRMLTILKLKVGPLGREAIADAHATSYALAKDALKKRFDNRMSVEAAIMKLSMARVDYAPDKFGESVRAIGDLIDTTIPDLAAASKLDVISQRLLSILKGHVQRRLLDRLGFYKSLDDLYTDLEFNNQMVNNFPNGRRPLQSRYEDIRCYNCNTPGHKMSQCKRLANGLPKDDYTVERKDISETSKTVCTVAAPSNTAFRPAVVMLPINGMPTQCLIDSGSAISMMYADYGIYYAAYGCDLKIKGATGVEETIKSYSKLDVNVGTKDIMVNLHHSKSSALLDKMILGMDFISQVSPTTITAEGIVLNNQLFKFVEDIGSTTSAPVDIARETVPVRSLSPKFQINNTNMVPVATLLLSNVDAFSRSTDTHDDEGFVNTSSMDKTCYGQCGENVPSTASEISKVMPSLSVNCSIRLMDHAETTILETIDAVTSEEAPAILLHGQIPIDKCDIATFSTTDVIKIAELSVWTTELSFLDTAWKYLFDSCKYLTDTVCRRHGDFEDVDPPPDALPISRGGEENPRDLLFKGLLNVKMKIKLKFLGTFQCFYGFLLFCEAFSGRMSDKHRSCRYLMFDAHWLYVFYSLIKDEITMVKSLFLNIYHCFIVSLFFLYLF